MRNMADKSPLGWLAKLLRPGRFFAAASPSQPSAVQPSTGMGSGADKGIGVSWRPRLETALGLYEIYCASWVAQRVVDKPGEAISGRIGPWRSFAASADPSVIATLREREAAHDIPFRVASAVSTARLFGTSFLVLMTAEAPLDTPLSVSRLKRGDLRNVLVRSRFQVSYAERQANYLVRGLGDPMSYLVTLPGGGTVNVHHSRMLRFDARQVRHAQSGVNVVTGRGQWSPSILTPLMDELEGLKIITRAVPHLVNEDGMLVVRTRDFGNASVAGVFEGDVTSDLRSRVQKMNESKSIYRVLHLDSEDEITRLGVRYGGLPQLMHEFSAMLAGACDIPVTILFQRSPGGVNATGVAEMDIWQSTVNVVRSGIDRVLPVLDRVLLADAGLSVSLAPAWTWPALIGRSEKVIAETSKLKTEAAILAENNGLVTMDEGRESLSGDPLYGELKGPAPGESDPMVPVPD